MDKYDKLRLLDQDIKKLEETLDQKREYQQTKINKELAYPLWKEAEEKCNHLEETIARKRNDYDKLLGNLQYSLF
ncbi:MAG: hypothetical protein ACO1OF_16310 [Adhaeribacter sp.]